MVGNVKNKKLPAVFFISFIVFVFTSTIACRSSALSETELPYGQSAALLQSELEEAAMLDSIPHYNLKLEIDMENASYNGNAVVDYTNLENSSLSSVFFRLLPNGGGTYGEGRLDISDLKINGSKESYIFSLDDSALEVILEKPLDPGGHLNITFNFKGDVPEDFKGEGYGIYSLKDDVMLLAGWYPIIAVYDDEGWNIDPVSTIGDSAYSDIAYYTVEIILPENLEHAATGTIVQEKENGKVVKYKYVSGPVRDFFIVVGREFQILSKEIDGIAVNIYYLPGHEQAADITLAIAKESLRTFNKRFGAYPYSELDIVDAPMNGSIAVEFPSIVVVGSSVFGNAVFTSHEIAHQWWYNVVGNDVIDDPWIDEALATYSSILYYEFSRSGIEHGQVLDYFISEYNRAVSSGKDDSIVEGLDYFEQKGGQHYSRIVYSKGAIFYHELRQEIGDRAFFNALSDYYQDMKYGIASGDDILDRFEEHSGRELDSFYEEWIY